MTYTAKTWDELAQEHADKCKAIEDKLAGKPLFNSRDTIGMQLSEIDKQMSRTDACRPATDEELSRIIEWTAAWWMAAAHEQGVREVLSARRQVTDDELARIMGGVDHEPAGTATGHERTER